MYKHFLIPTDGSELSHRAIESGVAFAATLGAKVTFLYAQPEYPLPLVGEGVMLTPDSREEFAAGTEDQAQRILAGAMEIAGTAKVTAQTKTRACDSPYALIIETAEKEGCDLVFMASHGRRGLAGLILGSETSKVLTHCKIPVLVYR